MGIFDKIGGSTVFGAGKYLANGKHVVRLTEIKQRPSQGEDEGELWINEFEIVESAVHKIGETYSWVVKLGGKSGPPDAKAFLVAAAQCVKTDITPDSMSNAEWSKFAEAAAGPSQALRNRVMIVEVFTKKTKTGGDFSKHIWKPVAIDGATAPIVPEVPPPPAPPPPTPPPPPFPPLFFLPPPPPPPLSLSRLHLL